MEQDVKEETETTMKRMQMRLREEEMRMLRGDEEEEFMGSGHSVRGERPGAASYRNSGESMEVESEGEESGSGSEEEEGGISMDDSSDENGGPVLAGTEDSSSEGDDNDF
jgi:clusterin-associated protein 1